MRNTDAGSSQYDIHEDFVDLPRFTLNFSRLQVGAINSAYSIIRFFKAPQDGGGIVSEKLRIPGREGHSICAYLYKPEDKIRNLPLYIYLHGGAFSATYAAKHMVFSRRYALEAGCAVMMVDYRLAPKHRFPAGFDDAYDVLLWVMSNAELLGVDKSRIIVGGDSAGGALAAGVAQKATDNGIPLCGQLLVYPVLDNRCCTESAIRYTDVPIWNSESNRRMWAMYIDPAQRERLPEYAAPGLRDHLAGLPPAYVETAEFDPLRDEGINYADRLVSAGVEVMRLDTRQTVHGYDGWGTQKSKISEASFAERVRFLRKYFGC